jgi:hypothetical protein
MQAIWHWLEREGASGDVVDWARPYDGDFDRLWSECPRGDWLLALAVRIDVERRLLVRAACSCARLALAHLPEDEDGQRLAGALEAAAAWSAGALEADACTPHKQVASQALEAARDAAAGAAGVAVLSALDAIWQAEAAVNAAAFAAQASVLGAGDCAMMEALHFTQRKSAQLVRAAISAQQASALWRARIAPADGAS